MAKQEHLDILKQGVDTWNAWKKNNRRIIPDLSNTNLARADLSFANLSRVNLSNSDLAHAELSYANLTRANLSNAILRGTDFFDSDLTRANLSNAILRRTNFSVENLSYADLTGARLRHTIFADVDLRLVKGLETVVHEGPSTIGMDTLVRSQGTIPEAFLKGAGVPDSIIEYARSLVTNPIEYYTCFISYSNKDQDFAERLYTDLQSKNVRCWYASEDLKIGDHYHQRIDESIRLYDKLILILSEHAVQSAWVEREVVTAREKEDHEHREVLFPIRLDDAVMGTTKAWAADVRRRWHIGDFTHWKLHDAYQKAFKRLLRNLKAEQKPKV